jgi:hypothetical protein
MLEKVLARIAITILTRLGIWAAKEIEEWFDRLQKDQSDREAREKLQKARDKEERIRKAVDLVNSATNGK